MLFPTVIRTYCLLACTLVSGVATSSEARYYPPPSTLPFEIGTEQFHEDYLSLRGLEGLHIDLSAVLTTGQDEGIIIPETLEQQVRDKIESAGLFHLSKEEMQVTPGQPMMNLWPNYTGAKTTKDNQSDPEDANACAIPDNCTNSLWVGFSQAASLLRQPENLYRLNTWGDGDDSQQCIDRGEWMAEAVLRKVDFFIAAYLKAQQDLAPVVVAKTSDIPELCSQSWLTHLNVFATNESTINEHVKPIFDRMITVAERCNNYNYIIETHADQRAGPSYNKILTDARARSIKDYLLSKGMAYERLKMRPLGESAPITQGSTTADHAKNSRLIIRPAKLLEFQNTELDY